MSNGTVAFQDSYFMRSGNPDVEKPLNYLTGSLFDPGGAENRQQQPHFITDEQRHLETYTESFALERLGTFFADYLYIMDSVDDGSKEGQRSGGALYLGHPMTFSLFRVVNVEFQI